VKSLVVAEELHVSTATLEAVWEQKCQHVRLSAGYEGHAYSVA
jgi:hypothetical protein